MCQSWAAIPTKLSIVRLEIDSQPNSGIFPAHPGFLAIPQSVNVSGEVDVAKLNAGGTPHSAEEIERVRGLLAQAQGSA